MIRISSFGNDRVRRVLALQRSTRRRYQENAMVVEGQRLVGELLHSSLTPQEIFVTGEFAEQNDDFLAAAVSVVEPASFVEVTDDIMQEMADTVTPQGILAVVRMPDLMPAAENRFILVPDQMRDPGNLGTILRSAWAAGVTEVVLPPGTVDPTNPKVVRAGMGAHFRLPIRRCEWEEVWASLAGAAVWLAEARQGTPYTGVDWRGDVALIIGGEAAGAGRSSRRNSDYVHIPMAPDVESLNAAVAAAVILFEAFRQRMGGGSVLRGSVR